MFENFNSFNLWTIVLILVLCGVAAIITYRVLKAEEKKQQVYEKSGLTAEEERERSLEYEKNSWRTNISALNWMYIIAIAISLIIFFVYMYTI